MSALYDLAVIGGGVNGCGIARDAAGRGLSVIVVEQNDLASGTSSASTKLIHGGLRYLEQREFRLVREALAEREVLLRAAPHLIWPIRFVLPAGPGSRPWWMLRAGLFLYDHLGGRKLLPATARLDLAGDPAGTPLRPEFSRAYEYSDCWVEDSRLVVLLARDAADRGAVIRTRTRCAEARQDGPVWRLRCEGGNEFAARVLVNAAGPWVREVLDGVLHQNGPSRVRLVKGSHIVTHRLFPHDRAYTLQNRDGRVCFLIPFEQDFTLIGTTDLDFNGDPAHPRITEEEERYLLEAASRYLRTAPSAADIVWRYSGVRPLYDDGKARAQDATRDYVLDLQAGDQRPPLLTVFGGKITTFRRLAEAALGKLAAFFPGLRAPWTASAALPGGDFAWNGADELIGELRARFPFLSQRTAERLIRSYGTRAERMLTGARRTADLGRVFGADLTECEVEWLVKQEWARSADDVLWRRTKLGLRFSPEQKAALEGWIARHQPGS